MGIAPEKSAAWAASGARSKGAPATPASSANCARRLDAQPSLPVPSAAHRVRVAQAALGGARAPRSPAVCTAEKGRGCRATFIAASLKLPLRCALVGVSDVSASAELCSTQAAKQCTVSGLMCRYGRVKDSKSTACPTRVPHSLCYQHGACVGRASCGRCGPAERDQILWL